MRNLFEIHYLVSEVDYSERQTRPPHWHFLQKRLKFLKSLLLYNKSFKFHVFLFLPVGSRNSNNGLSRGWENK